MSAVRKRGNPNMSKGGESLNPQGRPRGIKRSVSLLRRTLNTLRKEESTAISNIHRAVRGEAVPKQQLDSSEWLIKALESLTRAATQDEDNRNRDRSMGLPEPDDVAETEVEIKPLSGDKTQMSMGGQKFQLTIMDKE